MCVVQQGARKKIKCIFNSKRKKETERERERERESKQASYKMQMEQFKKF